MLLIKVSYKLPLRPCAHLYLFIEQLPGKELEGVDLRTSGMERGVREAHDAAQFPVTPIIDKNDSLNKTQSTL